MRLNVTVFEVVFFGLTGRKRKSARQSVEIARIPVGTPEPTHADLRRLVNDALVSIQARQSPEGFWRVRATPAEESTFTGSQGETITTTMTHCFSGVTLLENAYA